jgi:HJR/Mrr/RecB family endonuclease
MAQDVLDRWIKLAEKSELILDVWQKLDHRELEKTFKLWHERIIREMKELNKCLK